eukprot:scaffold98131_cov18-Prasinocladus_malaysianus.AAC.1
MRLLEEELTSVHRKTVWYTYPGFDVHRLWTTDDGKPTGSFPVITNNIQDTLSANEDIKFRRSTCPLVQ